MEVLKSGDAPSLVSNLEVMQLLQERVAARASRRAGEAGDGANGGQEATSEQDDDGGNGNTAVMRKGPFQNRDWIEQTVLSHLQASPVGGVGVKPSELSRFVERLRRDPSSFTQRHKQQEQWQNSHPIKDEGNSQNDREGSTSGYGLTNAEALQILNHLPTSLVEVHLLIEDIEKRENLDDDEKQLQFLKFISKYLGLPIVAGGGDDE